MSVSLIDGAEAEQRIQLRSLSQYERCAELPVDEARYSQLRAELLDDFQQRRVGPSRPSAVERAVVLAFALVALPLLLLLQFGFSVSPRILVPIGILAFTAMYLETRRGAKGRRRHSICPRCDYDLRSLPRPIEPAQAGFDPGPRRCPECGEPWPLVPDPPP